MTARFMVEDSKYPESQRKTGGYRPPPQLGLPARPFLPCFRRNSGLNWRLQERLRRISLWERRGCSSAFHCDGGRMRLRTALVIAGAFLALAIIPSRAADTLPSQLTDAAYWKMISDFSEPDGYYQYTVI